MTPYAASSHRIRSCAEICAAGTTPPRVVRLGPAESARLAAAATASTARQSRGFAFETGAIALVGLDKSAGGTDAWDAYDPATGTPYSFKTYQDGAAIMLGSLPRNGGVDEDFYIVAADWVAPGKTLTSVRVMHVPAAYWRSLFPADLTPYLGENAFAGISNSRADDAKWKVRLDYLKALWLANLPAGSPMRVQFKRDHKNQRRTQVVISAAGIEALFADLFCPTKTAELEAALRG